MQYLLPDWSLSKYHIKQNLIQWRRGQISYASLKKWPYLCDFLCPQKAKRSFKRVNSFQKPRILLEVFHLEFKFVQIIILQNNNKILSCKICKILDLSYILLQSLSVIDLKACERHSSKQIFFYSSLFPLNSSSLGSFSFNITRAG